VDNKSGKNLGHEPVLLDEAIAALRPEAGSVHVDATFGGGGYTLGILRRAPGARVVAVDRDPEAVARGRALAASRPDLTMVEGRFGDLVELLHGIGITQVDGIVADVGLSSYQLASPDRGFAFAEDGPLDMRMGGDGPAAAELLATLDEAELARLLRDYGDEPQARRIARLIVERRGREPLTHTRQLRDLVHRAKRGGHTARDPATRTFQALRIAVNDELGELERLLEAAAAMLVPGGRLVVVSFHSGEDRIVKRLVERPGGQVPGRSRHLPPVELPPRRFLWAQRGIIRPSAAEVERNPRARSARLRVALRAPVDEETAGPDTWRQAA
jgi:16S rRNA (cytosine1402-N4)-methyltransferase